MSENQMLQKEKRLYSSDADEETIDLVELFYALLGKWKQITAATLCGAVIAAIIVLFFITPKYQASSVLYVMSRTDSAINLSDIQIGSALTDDYVQVFHLWEVQEQIISNLNLSYSYQQLDSMLSVTNASNTRMLKIAVTSPSPEEAADIANEYAKVVRDYIAKKMKTDKPSIMSTALVPTAPVSPNKTKSVMIGALLGFVLSAGAYVLLNLLDDTYKTADDLRDYAGLVTFAVIPVEPTNEPKRGKKQIGLKLPGGKKL